jgi:hypothetical protein
MRHRQGFSPKRDAEYFSVVPARDKNARVADPDGAQNVVMQRISDRDDALARARHSRASTRQRLP